MPTQRRVWPPDLWSAALRATQSTSWALCGGRDACEQVRAQHPGWRAWAFDLGQRPGASNHPKRYVAAPVAVFAAAYALLPAEHRHAYEIIDVPCDLDLDLVRGRRPAARRRDGAAGRSGGARGRGRARR